MVKQNNNKTDNLLKVRQYNYGINLQSSQRVRQYYYEIIPRPRPRPLLVLDLERDLG